MSDSDLTLLAEDARGSWLRLRTLILLRWLAILGQTVAVAAAAPLLGLQVPLGPCALVIGAAVVFNVMAMVGTAQNRRLTEGEATLTLLFDVGQLGTLLLLTGGISNPFALLMIAPVTISASLLSRRSTILLAAAACAIVSLLAFAAPPLRRADGALLEPPSPLLLGSWAAIVIGIVFLAFYARQVNREAFSMSQALGATQMALEREQRLTTLSGVVAAAAHEFGTPLATIKLLSAELADELGDRPQLREDALLIRAQADRCRDILRTMGPRGREDELMRFAPISGVIEEAAAPHAGRGTRIITRVEGALVEEGTVPQPELARRAEIIQGLRNLVQNAVDFAHTAVWIDIDWTVDNLRVRIGDDGPGYPPEVIGRIGEPFVRRKSGSQKERPGYEGMGLGLFIAKTLLERSGARLDFGNGSEPSRGMASRGPAEFARPTGAIVTVTWPRGRVTRPE
ncbi:sensor histidine kinase RegB [Amaricoccus sp.]|uniref:sensor histidine kinase RegB n=1 Tax=Amaricoccus sp. TaxID=1872485 RepID=UPI00261593CD|nr:ActS/PrrB/RegB family redox-sensitive histidine kinase [uncultured Amaricoccus sp.]